MFSLSSQYFFAKDHIVLIFLMRYIPFPLNTVEFTHQCICFICSINKLFLFWYRFEIFFYIDIEWIYRTLNTIFIDLIESWQSIITIKLLQQSKSWNIFSTWWRKTRSKYHHVFSPKKTSVNSQYFLAKEPVVVIQIEQIYL